MFKKGVWTLVCVLVILGFGIADGYGKTAKKCQKTEVSAADANSTKTSPMKTLMKKCGLNKDKKACKKTCICQGCPADCKCTCCAKRAADPNAASDPNSKDTSMMKSMMKKCGFGQPCGSECKCACCKKKCAADSKKACCDKKVADANSTDPNDTGMIKKMMKKCGLKKGCCKKPADANCPAAK